MKQSEAKNKLCPFRTPVDKDSFCDGDLNCVHVDCVAWRDSEIHTASAKKGWCKLIDKKSPFLHPNYGESK